MCSYQFDTLENGGQIVLAAAVATVAASICVLAGAIAMITIASHIDT